MEAKFCWMQLSKFNVYSNDLDKKEMKSKKDEFYEKDKRE